MITAIYTAAGTISNAITTAVPAYWVSVNSTTTSSTATTIIPTLGTGYWVDLPHDRAAAQRWAASNARYEQERRARELSMQRAQRRAKSLLEEFLTPLQREQLRDLGAFTMRGASGRRYRIREGRTSNVAVLGPDGRPLHRLCAHPSELVPDADTMLTQLFMLRDAEAEAAFLAKANRH